MKEYTEFAKNIALEAGDLLLSHFRSDKMEISYKSRTDLVTNMDKASEALLYERVHSRYPEHSIVAEEGSLKETNHDIIWYIDPLDGTNNYAHGLPFFAVSIGVYSQHKNTILSGVVYNPFLNEMFFATRDEGAFLNNNIIKTSSIESLGTAIIATGFPYEKENPETNNSKQFSTMLPLIQGIRRMGSAALDLSYVACGRLDGYWEQNLQPWDICAGMIIADEAGATVTNYDGNAYYPTMSKVIASNKNIYHELHSAIKMSYA